jgi:hypothetical protein
MVQLHEGALRTVEGCLVKNVEFKRLCQSSTRLSPFSKESGKEGTYLPPVRVVQLTRENLVLATPLARGMSAAANMPKWVKTATGGCPNAVACLLDTDGDEGAAGVLGGVDHVGQRLQVPKAPNDAGGDHRRRQCQ